MVCSFCLFNALCFVVIDKAAQFKQFIVVFPSGEISITNILVLMVISLFKIEISLFTLKSRYL